MQAEAVFYWPKPMRLQAHLTNENTDAIMHLLADVNAAREAAGLEPVSLQFLTNNIIDRIAQMPTVQLCDVYVTRTSRRKAA